MGLFFSRYYNGYRPSVVTTNLEIIKKILVKDFTNFMDRPVWDMFDMHCLYANCVCVFSVIVHFHVNASDCWVLQLFDSAMIVGSYSCLTPP